VIETTGEVAGSTVTWQPSLSAGAATELQAAWEERDRTAERARSWQRWTRTAIWVWLLIVAALAVGVAVVLARRRAH
jgi:anti-sigma-K factor RskA